MYKANISTGLIRPFAPGCEIAGIVNAVGDGVDIFKPGDRVAGFPGWGGYAEEVVTEASRLVALPSSIEFDVGACLPLTYGTSHYALKDRAALRPGETLLVLGAAGGVGLAAVEIGKAMGARIIACASSDEKLAICREYGADEVINYSKNNLKDAVKELTDGAGVDVVYDPVGGDLTELALRGTGWGGRLRDYRLCRRPDCQDSHEPHVAKRLFHRRRFLGLFCRTGARSQPRKSAGGFSVGSGRSSETAYRPTLSACRSGCCNGCHESARRSRKTGVKYHRLKQKFIYLL